MGGVRFGLAAIWLIVCAFTAQAQTVLNANDRGWYNNSGSHSPTNNNSFTGGFSNAVYRSYFRFTIPAGLTCVAGATLDLELEAFYVAGASHDLTVYDVAPANVPLLDTANGSGSGAAIFTDLGSGAAYGGLTGVVSTDVGSVLTFTLSPQAAADIIAAAGTDFALGVDLTTTSTGTRGVRFSAGNEARIHRLTLQPCPNMTGAKTNAVFDPAGTGLYAVPGQDMLYTITIENTGAGPVDADTVVLIDALPPEVSFFNADIDTGGPDTYPGSDPIGFVDAASGLTFTYGADVAFSNAVATPANFAACTYSPAAGYDPAVTHICVNPKGVMAASSGLPHPGFSVTFRARID